MKEALFFKKLDGKPGGKQDGKVQCSLCPHNCIIAQGGRGLCRVRKNEGGMLYSLVYGRPCAAAVDPIEKKPLYHFLPGTRSFSIGTAGCNLSCSFCQNWESSQKEPEEVPSLELAPKEAVDEARRNRCASISYTYNEPSIFYEYVLDTARLARKNGLRNVMVTNGYINIEPLRKLYTCIDAANIDLKSFEQEFYRKTCRGDLMPVLDAVKEMQRLKVWIELTTLIIPGLNDDLEMLGRMCRWIVANLGNDVPLHFSAFHPSYKLTSKPSTRQDILNSALGVAKKEGIRFVYIGNIVCDQSTHCPSCSNLLIEREGYFARMIGLKKGKCLNCGIKIPGVWE